MSLRIYVSGPYTAPTSEQVEANVQHAIDAGIVLMKRGHWPYIPHLTHWVEQRSLELGAGLTYMDYLNLDLAWIPFCDGFLYLGSSPGADVELKHAKKWGIRVYHSLEAIPDA